MMELHNLIEDDVISVINKLAITAEDWCNCDKCKMDIAALALNNLKPQYVITEKGNLLGRANNLTQQYKTDVTLEVSKAIAIVGPNPQHE